MRVKGPGLGHEARVRALLLDAGSQADEGVGAGFHPQPRHASPASPPERAQPAEPHLESLRPAGRDAVRDRFDGRELDRADEPDSQVQVVRNDPSERRCRGGARVQVLVQPLAAVLGQRQPEEAANRQRVGLVQWDGAQAPGRLGRQP